MKIHFLLVTVDHLAGTERAAVAQANALADGHEVEIVSVLRTANRNRADVDPRVRVRYLTSVGGEVHSRGVDHVIDSAPQLAALPSTLVPQRWDPTLNALCDVALERYLPASTADVVVTMTPGMLAAAAQRLPGRVALVHQEHRSSMHRQGGLEPLLTFAPRADAVASLTEVNAVWLRRRLGAQAPPIHVVPNAAPGPEQPRAALERPLILAAGRLENEKQHVQLVHAFGSIADEIPDWRLRIFGTGYMHLGLMRAARRHGLYDRVELPGATTDLAAEWATASISALTSYREGLPLVVQESFAAGVPVVAYDCPTGPSELIEHGVNGFLVPMGDEETLAGHLLQLARDRDLRLRLGAAARESLARFEKGAILARWERIYADAVASRRAGEPWLTRQLDPIATDDRDTIAPAPAITPDESRRRLVEITAVAMAGIPNWFVLPARGEQAPVFVVPQEQRVAWLRAVAAADYPDHVSIAVGEQDHWLTQRGSVEAMTEALGTAFVKGLSIEPWPEDGGHASHLSQGAGIRVEFWSRDAQGCLVAAFANHVGRRVDPAADIDPACTVHGVRVPGLADMRGPFIDECRFPIDAVYTWVDGADPAWGADRDEALAAIGRIRREAAGAARFRNRDELRYSLRSIHAHAPWLRRIHIVTAGQRPAWLVDHPRVRVVDHREILPDDALPTFNSHAIETALHRIPGLSEHFLYFNDDMFLARPLEPTRFFAPAGSFAAFVSQSPVGLEGRDDRPFVAAAINGRELLRERFGVTLTQMLTHLPYPLRVSVMEEMCEEFREAIDRTAHNRFRAATDVSPTSSLAQYYGLATGRAHEDQLNLEFVDTSRGNLRPRLNALLQRDAVDAFCLGDHHDYALPEARVNEFLAEFFDAYFPVRGPWEAQG